MEDQRGRRCRDTIGSDHRQDREIEACARSTRGSAASPNELGDSCRGRRSAVAADLPVVPRHVEREQPGEHDHGRDDEQRRRGEQPVARRDGDRTPQAARGDAPQRRRLRRSRSPPRCAVRGTGLIARSMLVQPAARSALLALLQHGRRLRVAFFSSVADIGAADHVGERRCRRRRGTRSPARSAAGRAGRSWPSPAGSRNTACRTSTAHDLARREGRVRAGAPAPAFSMRAGSPCWS